MHAPEGKPEGLSPPAYGLPISQRPTLPDSVGGDPAWDFARLFVGMGDPASADLADRALPWVLEGYGPIDLSRVPVYRCVVSLLEYACNVWHKWPEWIESSRALLLQRLDAGNSVT